MEICFSSSVCHYSDRLLGSGVIYTYYFTHIDQVFTYESLDDTLHAMLFKNSFRLRRNRQIHRIRSRALLKFYFEFDCCQLSE